MDSKYLSYLLRHHPEAENLHMDSEGYVPVAELMHITSMRELKTIVETDKKQRYSFSKDGTKIRANQGHSIPVKISYERVTPPDTLYHGTSDRFLESIMSSGLQKQSRQYIHLSSDIETAINVGKRHGGKTIVFRVKAYEMAKDGYEFFKSENGVYLVNFVPWKYLLI